MGPMSETTAEILTPPQAKKVPTTRTHHGDIVTDHYEWLREKELSLIHI